MTQAFTGQEADGGTASLDFYNARHFAAALESFMQPDPYNAGADLVHPQSWNGYGYVLGNQLGLVDPSGMMARDVDDGDGTGIALMLRENHRAAGSPFMMAAGVAGSCPFWAVVGGRRWCPHRLLLAEPRRFRRQGERRWDCRLGWNIPGPFGMGE